MTDTPPLSTVSADIPYSSQRYGEPTNRTTISTKPCTILPLQNAEDVPIQSFCIAEYSRSDVTTLRARRGKRLGEIAICSLLHYNTQSTMLLFGYGATTSREHAKHMINTGDGCGQYKMCMQLRYVKGTTVCPGVYHHCENGWYCPAHAQAISISKEVAVEENATIMVAIG